MLGIFDSGVGGLTVLQSIKRELPELDILYLADQKYVPYGDKTHEEIFELTWRSIEWMFDQGCTLVILACNSASARALRKIQREKLKDYPGRNVLGVIRPTTEWILDKDFLSVALFATGATCRSEAYEKELGKIKSNLKLFCHAFPSWVPLIESGKVTSNELEQVKDDVNLALDKTNKLEAIILACTHYPVLFEAVRSVVPKNVQVISQGDIVALSLKDYLKRNSQFKLKTSADKLDKYYTTGDAEKATRISNQLLNMNAEFEHIEIDLQKR